MDNYEQKNDWANQTVYWTQSVPPCSTRDECLQVMDQIEEDVLGKDISEQSLIEELASIDLHFDDEMQALLLLSSLLESWETLVVSLSNFGQDGKLTMSTVKDALFNEETRKKDMGMTNQSESQALISDGSRERGRGHHRSNGRGRPRDKKMFSTYAVCEGLVRMANNTTNKVVDKGTVRFRMADGSIAAKGGILRISKGNKEMLRGRKTRGLYRLEGSVQIRRATVRHGSSDIRRKNGQGKQQDVHRKAQRKETKSILKSCTSTGATTPKRVSFALDLISGGDLSRCVHKGGEREPRRLAKQSGNMYKNVKKKIERGVAFPTCTTENNTVCHFSPLASDETVLEDGDMINIDLGCHIDGFIAVVAHTHVLHGGSVTGRQAAVIAAANTATEVALRLIRPGRKVDLLPAWILLLL
ncbi:metallopeptidase M24 family protein [Actinidia rufa]|uniref:Metallopeptidase M24 family protein n=1 Tax=Actinidia rufa TaxID=165716 RepID=A0A7J0FU15_9ERIC|nr:metallopeptidase M24 family protein [Actinidia rufa]